MAVRPGNAGANNIADHIALLDAAIAGLPPEIAAGHRCGDDAGRYGATYGLCQIWRNEPWHYELRPDAGGRGWPRMYTDPTSAPRMQP